MHNNHKIFALLNKMDSQTSLNELIEICDKIAISYLRFNHKKVYKLLQIEDLSIEEFALDAIAPLFI